MMGDMFDWVKKGVLFNVGLVAYTVDKTAELYDDIVKKGDEALEKFQETTDKSMADIDEKVKTQVQAILEKMEIPTKKDIQEINKKLDGIAKKV